jgi:hypothetical protein
MQDYENRKLTKGEKLGVSAALIMFFSIGMIMGGSAAGNDRLVLIGGLVFSIGAAIALWLLFKHKPKDEDF